MSGVWFGREILSKSTDRSSKNQITVVVHVCKSTNGAFNWSLRGRMQRKSTSPRAAVAKALAAKDWLNRLPRRMEPQGCERDRWDQADRCVLAQSNTNTRLSPRDSLKSCNVTSGKVRLQFGTRTPAGFRRGASDRSASRCSGARRVSASPSILVRRCAPGWERRGEVGAA